MTGDDGALTEQECWELLATASVGRVALSVRALPVILPVRYHLSDRRLAVCLGYHGLPERALDNTIIAFAADSIDPVTGSGWSVQVQGRSAIPRELTADAGRGWPGTAQVAEIEPGTVRGQRLRLCPSIDARGHQDVPPPGRRAQRDGDRDSAAVLAEPDQPGAVGHRPGHRVEQIPGPSPAVRVPQPGWQQGLHHLAD